MAGTVAGGPRSPRMIFGGASIGAATLARGAALVFLELGALTLIAAGIAEASVGALAPVFLLAAIVVGWGLRLADLENAARFVPGGAYGAAREAFGETAARISAAALLVEYMLFGVLVASAAGHSVAAVVRFVPSFGSTARQLALDDVSTTCGALLTGIVWWWRRTGRSISGRFRVWTVAVGATALAAIAAAAAIRAVVGGGAGAWAGSLSGGVPISAWRASAATGACLFAAGGTQVLDQALPDFPQPRIQGVRRTAAFVSAYVLIVSALSALAFVCLPPALRDVWHDAPIAVLALSDGRLGGVARLLAALVALAGALVLAMSVDRATGNMQHHLLRLTEHGVLPAAMRTIHPRFGTPTRLIDASVIALVGLLFMSAGRLNWLAGAYGVAIAASAVLKVAALVRLRKRHGRVAFRVPLNPSMGGRERPVGLAVVAALVAIPASALLLTGNPGALAGGALLLAAATAFVATARTRVPEALPRESFDRWLPPATVGLDSVAVAPGSLLVPVRRPGMLTHLTAALQGAGKREVVAMTARLIGVDASEERASAPEPTDEERRLMTSVALAAEQYGREVRLLIVPSTNVFEAVALTAVRLRPSDVYVGESETLSADEQARRLGAAWESASKLKDLDTRLIIQHASGGSAVYHLGAHAPSLSADDLHLIHQLWLDAVKSIGPHVHHRDIVLAALTHMREQLDTDGPDRDAALDLIRRTAHPSDDLAAVVHARDFGRLRDMVRNRPASDLAAMLTDLSIEDQVVAFRVLPRKMASATFEYLSHDAQQALLRAMAQEDVAAILNDMAPDDRTTFLEELPAAATQQLLTLLTPQERGVAAALLGYPEHSIGRLMTPDYVAVREQWTVQDVLDYIRTHGQDSETLNVIYVVDDRGVLIDDLRIRELLLTSPSNRVADLMDRRFVALSAAADQDEAVQVFRREDRSALPVTDSAGVLIGIVTIDDVLDVAEAAATKDIQRLGGSEALDEPYMRIAFSRMVRKRAGWLTALFLGEMLTATAMAAFEHEIERAVVLALFVPLIISSGGNSGSQASTLVIRAIALGEVTLRDWWQVARREIAAGLALGAILGAIGFMRITIWSAFSTLYGEHWLLVAVTVGLALVGVVLWGTLMGSLLPFVLKRLGFDPATSSAPFVATLVDVTGLIIYFSVGLVVLRGTLL